MSAINEYLECTFYVTSLIPGKPLHTRERKQNFFCPLGLQLDRRWKRIFRNNFRGRMKNITLSIPLYPRSIRASNTDRCIDQTKLSGQEIFSFLTLRHLLHRRITINIWRFVIPMIEYSEIWNKLSCRRANFEVYGPTAHWFRLWKSLYWWIKRPQAN